MVGFREAVRQDTLSMLLTLYQESLPVEVWGQVSQSPLSGTGLGLSMKLEKYAML